jgi:N-acetylneuraminate synthase
VAIGDRLVGAGQPTYVIAELSANHGHDLDRAKAIIRAAAQAGADAVKLQTYTADAMTLDLDGGPFRIGEGTAWAGRRLYDLYTEAAMPWEWHRPLLEEARGAGIDLFSTPFDRAAADLLVDLGTPALKVASFEIVDLPLIEDLAARELPLVISTGMATAEEVDEAVRAAAAAPGVVLLRCNSAYPARPEEMDLRTIPEMARRWSVPVGLSDHTLDGTAATVAVALGASVLEKHVTLRRADGGPDASFSLEPAELADQVAAVRTAEAAAGEVRFGPSPREQASLAFRRSLWVVQPIRAGEMIAERHVRSLRPAGGLAPKHLSEVVGRRVAADAAPGTPVTWELLA